MNQKLTNQNQQLRNETEITKRALAAQCESVNNLEDLLRACQVLLNQQRDSNEKLSDQLNALIAAQQEQQKKLVSQQQPGKILKPLRGGAVPHPSANDGSDGASQK
eukprot:TRINITY_DN8142_c0_g1_i1.p1 TRINITY_DN8142_c0_g1~~TRINITY_DN8142_c0_g1_i1.p1  ORF type:complete len:106 (-),score=40.13 TRINITY_DN8142_c0_g1_i1:185-502(-)